MGTRRLAIRFGAGVLLALSTTALLFAAGGGAGGAELHIYWAKSTRIGWQCSRGAIKVVLDDKQIAEIHEKDCVRLAIAPGNHVLQGIKQALVKRKDFVFEADPDKNIFVRGNCNSDGKFEWNLQTADQAKEWVETCQAAR
jgi:hypothetical protein